MRKYKHIFFDLDHTLLDFEKCSSETLQELYSTYQLAGNCNFTSDTFITKFSEVNGRLWDQFNVGKIDRNTLRELRFKLVFNELNFNDERLLNSFTADYLDKCPKKGYLIPYAKDLLDYLTKKYELHLITNGFEEIQLQKIESAGIAPYFKEIFTSEKTGFRKPEKGMFRFALNTVNCEASKCIMIGDSIEADILGASNSQIDSIFFNPKKLKFYLSVTHEVRCLSEILQLL